MLRGPPDSAMALHSNDAWDIVILGWVLSYGEMPEAAVREIVRVTRRGGIVAVAVSYYPHSWLEEAERAGRTWRVTARRSSRFGSNACARRPAQRRRGLGGPCG
ncbi:MAG: methyltransferase domain-containing protein [bacterium]